MSCTNITISDDITICINDNVEPPPVDPNDPDVFMGALNSKPHLEKVKKYGRLATEEGGTIHCGFGMTQINVASDLQNGYYFPPTIVTGLTNNSRQVFHTLSSFL